MKTNEIVKANNRKLLNKLIPKGNEPIFGNSLTNPKDKVFDLPLTIK